MRFCALCDTYGCPSCNWTGKASVYDRKPRVAPHLRARAGASAYAYTAAPAVRPSAGHLHRDADPPPSVAIAPRAACHVAGSDPVALASGSLSPLGAGATDSFMREEMWHDYRRGDA